jgi:hypothetical protein
MGSHEHATEGTPGKSSDIVFGSIFCVPPLIRIGSTVDPLPIESIGEGGVLAKQ